MCCADREAETCNLDRPGGLLLAAERPLRSRMIRDVEVKQSSGSDLASLAAAKKRTEKRLATQGQVKPAKKSPKRK